MRFVPQHILWASRPKGKTGKIASRDAATTQRKIKSRIQNHVLTVLVFVASLRRRVR
jgi:hypothetical protein